MTEQEKIRQEIKTILRRRYGENWIHSKVSLQIVHTLTLQGVAIKLEEEPSATVNADGEQVYYGDVPSMMYEDGWRKFTSLV